MLTKRRTFDMSIKAVREDGFFLGYASVFDVVDSDKDIVKPGAFRDTLADYKIKGRKLPILWQHRSDIPLGVYERVEEDSKGLYVEGKLLIEDVARAREAYALAKAGAVTGLSIGYATRESSYDERTNIRVQTH